MNTGKRSLVSTFVAAILGLVSLTFAVTEAQARPYHGHRSARATVQTQQCDDLFGSCASGTGSNWDAWQGYVQPSSASYRARSARATRRYNHTADTSSESSAWGNDHPGVLGTAQSMVGMSERSNRGSLRRTLGIDPARTPWCAAWANAVLRRNGYHTTGSNMARSFYGYGSRSGGNIGDIAVMPHHVGFVAGYTVRNGRRYVGVLGGNTSNRVKTAWYPASRVSFRDPN